MKQTYKRVNINTIKVQLQILIKYIQQQYLRDNGKVPVALSTLPCGLHLLFPSPPPHDCFNQTFLKFFRYVILIAYNINSLNRSRPFNSFENLSAFDKSSINNKLGLINVLANSTLYKTIMHVNYCIFFYKFSPSFPEKVSLCSIPSFC